MTSTTHTSKPESRFELKPLSRSAIPSALEKAIRYRLLNEPIEAESICCDILAIEPENQQALVTLLLALTDRFGEGYSAGLKPAQEVLPRLKDTYEQAYYAGVICERQAKAHLQSGSPRSGGWAYEMIREAMACYEKAEAIRPEANDDAILRWNACFRILSQNQHLQPREDERYEHPLE